MTQSLADLFQHIKSIKNKILDYHNCFDESFDNQSYIKFLEDKLDSELVVLSEKFQVSKNAVFILSAVLDMYIKSDGIRINFITINDIKKFFHPDFLISTIIFRDRILELEEKNILEIKDIDHYPVRVFYDTDRTQNDYFLLPAKPSFMPFANKKFEFTESFINKLKQL